MHKGDTYGVPSKYWNGVLPSGRTVNLDQRNGSQMEWQVKLLKAVCKCSSRFVSGSIVRVPECVRALLRQTQCSDDLVLARISTLFSRFVRVQLFCTRE